MDLDDYLFDQPTCSGFIMSNFEWPPVCDHRKIWFWGISVNGDPLYRWIKDAIGITGGIYLLMDRSLALGWERRLVVHPIYGNVEKLGMLALSPVWGRDDAWHRFKHNVDLHRRTYDIGVQPGR